MRVCAGIWALTMTACVFDGLVIEDQSGFSSGPGRDGVLYEGTELPAMGEGYWIPPTWSQRGLNFGVEELASLLVYSGRALKMHDERLLLGIADMSRARGGRSAWHRSHQTGRDVDLLFFVANEDGVPLVNTAMLHHRPDGSSRGSAKDEGGSVHFDVRANWLLVSVLLNNPVAEVQYLFIQDDLRQLLLQHAEDTGVSRSLLARATEILRQPGDSAPHDDHMHVRIYCPKNDLAAGCQDFGQMRWHKRDYKYESRIERLPGYEHLVPPGVVTVLPWLFR